MFNFFCYCIADVVAKNYSRRTETQGARAYFIAAENRTVGCMNIANVIKTE